MKYNSLLPISKIEADKILKTTNDEKSICELIFRIVYHIDDLNWLEEKIFIISQINNININKCIITSISDIVRIHWELPKKLKKLLNSYEKDSKIKDYLSDYLDDIKYLLKSK